MSNEFFATCGVRIGGQGEWETRPAKRCQLEVVSFGLKVFLDKLTTFMENWYECGLYQNDRQPLLDDTIADYVQANFSGYLDRQVLTGWTTAAMVGPRAKSSATQLVWKHDGGPVSNLIYGYYVTDKLGNLVFAERFCDGPFEVDRAGRAIRLTPVFSAQNQREGE